MHRATWRPGRRGTAVVTVAWVVVAAAGDAVFPRLAHRLRWSQRLGPRGRIVDAVATAVDRPNPRPPDLGR